MKAMKSAAKSAAKSQKAAAKSAASSAKASVKASKADAKGGLKNIAKTFSNAPKMTPAVKGPIGGIAGATKPLRPTTPRPRPTGSVPMTPRSPIKPVTGGGGGLRNMVSQGMKAAQNAGAGRMAGLASKLAGRGAMPGRTGTESTPSGIGAGLMGLLGKAAQPAMKKGGKVPAKKKKYV